MCPVNASAAGNRAIKDRRGHSFLEEVDTVIPVKPRQCHRCQHTLQGAEPQPHRHQVTELPPVQPVVTEYQLHRLVCPACGASTRATLPVGVPPGGFGPRVQAIVALCTGAYRLSKRTTQEVMADLFGLPMSLGTIPHLEQATVQAVATPVADAQVYVRAQPVAHLDETDGAKGEHARGCGSRSPCGSPSSRCACRVGPMWRKHCWASSSAASW